MLGGAQCTTGRKAKWGTRFPIRRRALTLSLVAGLLLAEVEYALKGDLNDSAQVYGGSMKKVLLLCFVLGVVISIGHAFGQMAVPGQGVTGVNVDNVVELQYLTSAEVTDK